MEHPSEIHSEELNRLYPESWNLLLLREIYKGAISEQNWLIRFVKQAIWVHS
jgi:hypothetical protein